MPAEHSQINVASPELSDRLSETARRTADWLWQRKAKDDSRFSLCQSSLVTSELNAATGAIELWIMLGLPIDQQTRRAFAEHLQSFQNPETGLVVDPSWSHRQMVRNDAQMVEGDTFFTMTTASALEALGSHFLHPVAYLVGMHEDALAAATALSLGAHNRFAIGDYGSLIRTNAKLDVTSACGQHRWLLQYVYHAQDAETGFWAHDGGALTPSINRAFHILRSTLNPANAPIRHADRLIDACLAASGDPEFYGRDTGYACNDLDLAHVAYSAARWTDHRREELSEAAMINLLDLLEYERPEGGFGFYHDRAMETHGGIAMSPGRAESDTWGTLMYLGAIKMWAELLLEPPEVPWQFSFVHAVPQGELR